MIQAGSLVKVLPLLGHSLPATWTCKGLQHKLKDIVNTGCYSGDREPKNPVLMHVSRVKILWIFLSLSCLALGHPPAPPCLDWMRT